MTIIRIATIMLALFGIATEDRAAIAQIYPSKPIKLVVPYPPGGPNDVIARILAQKLAEGVGGTFFVENTAGAGGTIATGQAANAATDGTTILVANQDLIVQPIIILPTVAPHIRAGTMRPLTVAASKRTPYFPDVPSIAEAGYPGHEVGFWMGVFVPAGTPKDLVDILNKQVARVMALPDVKERMATIGFDPTLSTSQELTDHMKAETDKWSKVVRQANIKID